MANFGGAARLTEHKDIIVGACRPHERVPDRGGGEGVAVDDPYLPAGDVGQYVRTAVVEEFGLVERLPPSSQGGARTHQTLS